jgi:succinate-semialdehyde dehydrogenase/glutarate-semialdehyde dehydrogenase
VWTRDIGRARQAAERLQAGNVWINSLHIGYDEMPFGGVKFSGIGREHGPEALEYYLETKGVVVATSKRRNCRRGLWPRVLRGHRTCE